MTRKAGRHTQWPEGAWISMNTGKVYDGILDHMDFALANPSYFGLTNEAIADIKTNRTKKTKVNDGKADFLRSLIMKGWIRARGQYFDVPKITSNVLMEIYSYGDHVGVWPDEIVYVNDIETGRKINAPLKELGEMAMRSSASLKVASLNDLDKSILDKFMTHIAKNAK